MPNVTPSYSLIVTPPLQRVEVGGVHRAEVECISITRTAVLRPSSARLRFPKRMSDAVMGWLRDASVVVYTKPDTGSNWGDPVFVGFVRVDSRREDPFTSVVEVEAASVMHLLDRVTVGQRQGQAVYKFPRKGTYSELPTGWTLSAILKTLFTSDFLDANWRTVIGLGDLSGLEAAQFDLQMPDVTFHTASWRQALRQLLALVPDVGVTERFDSSGKTLLDFFQWGAPQQGGHVIVAQTENEGPEEGAAVEAYVAESDTDEVYSRAIGYGRPAEFMITLGTDHGSAPLEPAWDGASSYAVEELTAAELRVIADPKITQRGEPQFDEELEWVFRRFKLPDLFKPWAIMGRNLYKSESVVDGRSVFTNLGIQVFTERFVYTPGLNPFELNGSPAVTTWKIVQGAQVDTKNRMLLLPRPALEPEKFTVVGGVPKIELARVHVFVTLSVFHPEGRRLFWDTGIRGDVRHPIVRDSGLVLEFENKSAGYSQIGSLAETFRSPDGVAHDFGCTWFDPVEGWQSVAAGSPVELENELGFLADLTERALSERNQARTRATIGLPYYTPSLNAGDAITLLNRGIDGKQMRVCSVVMGLINPITVIEATDQAPFAVNLDEKAPEAGRERDFTPAVGRNPFTALEEYGDALANPAAARVGNRVVTPGNNPAGDYFAGMDSQPGAAAPQGGGGTGSVAEGGPGAMFNGAPLYGQLYGLGAGGAGGGEVYQAAPGSSPAVPAYDNGSLMA